MATKFHSDDSWSRIRDLAKKRGRRLVAVPFLGNGAIRRLPLQAGDLLIVRLDEATVKSGQTSPFEIGKFLRKGVEVHAQSNLHAKVFVFGKTAVIGSTNVSTTSEEHLLEAVVETSDLRAVSAAATFVRSLRGDVVTPQYAKRLEKMYVPPRILGAGRPRSQQTMRGAGQSVLWAVKLETGAWIDEDYVQQDAGEPLARKKLKNTRHYVVDDFVWTPAGFGRKVRVGQRVLQIVEESSERVYAEAPYRVVRVQRYRVGNSSRVMVFVERKKRSRRVGLGRLLERLGPMGERLNGLKTSFELKDKALVYQLGQIWGTD
ncbi:MAG: phospholipase D family protein [Holophagales bacterium]|nr:phospholipase D family protein [Holophagales bacterium]